MFPTKGRKKKRRNLPMLAIKCGKVLKSNPKLAIHLIFINKLCVCVYFHLFILILSHIPLSLFLFWLNDVHCFTILFVSEDENLRLARRVNSPNENHTKETFSISDATKPLLVFTKNEKKGIPDADVDHKKVNKKQVRDEK